MNPFIYKAKVLRIVDGDTCDVMLDLGFNSFMKGRVRLVGIDTPESRTRDLTEKKYGKAAKQIVPHVHVHIIPRYSNKGTTWTKRSMPSDIEQKELCEKIKKCF